MTMGVVRPLVVPEVNARIRALRPAFHWKCKGNQHGGGAQKKPETHCYLPLTHLVKSPAARLRSAIQLNYKRVGVSC